MLDFCRTCSGFKKPHSASIAPPQFMFTGLSGQIVGIDIAGPLSPIRTGSRYIVVMIDFTKVAGSEPTKSQDAETFASIFFNRWICQHGGPWSIHGSRKPTFCWTVQDLQDLKDRCDAWAFARQRTGRKNESRPHRTTKGFYYGGTVWRLGFEPGTGICTTCCLMSGSMRPFWFSR